MERLRLPDGIAMSNSKLLHVLPTIILLLLFVAATIPAKADVLNPIFPHNSTDYSLYDYPMLSSDAGTIYFLNETWNYCSYPGVQYLPNTDIVLGGFGFMFWGEAANYLTYSMIYNSKNDSCKTAYGASGNLYTRIVAVSKNGRSLITQSNNYNGQYTVVLLDNNYSYSSSYLFGNADGYTNGNPIDPIMAISDNGNYIAYVAETYNQATNNYEQHLFRYDNNYPSVNTQIDLLNSNQVENYGDADDPRWDIQDLRISNDGNSIAFSSFRSFVSGYLNNYDYTFCDYGYYDLPGKDVYLCRLTTGLNPNGAIVRVSLPCDSTYKNVSSFGIDMTSDGQYISFCSAMDNGNSISNGGFTYLEHGAFVYSTVSQSVTRVDVDNQGIPMLSYGGPVQTSLSSDGRFVTFDSDASNTTKIYRHDRKARQNASFDVPGNTNTLCINSFCTLANQDNETCEPTMSGDGRYITFVGLSDANESTAGTDIYLVDTNNFFPRLSHCPAMFAPGHDELIRYVIPSPFSSQTPLSATFSIFARNADGTPAGTAISTQTISDLSAGEHDFIFNDYTQCGKYLAQGGYLAQLTVTSAALNYTATDTKSFDVPARPPHETACMPYDGPVNLVSGGLELDPITDLSVYNAQGPLVAFRRSYSSLRAKQGYGSPGWTPGWLHNYDIYLSAPSTQTTGWGHLALCYPNGAEDVISLPQNPAMQTAYNYPSFPTPSGSPYFVTGVSGTAVGQWATITVTWDDETQWLFTPDPTGNGNYLLTNIVTQTGQSLSLQWDNGGQRILQAVSANGAALFSLQYHASSTVLSSSDGRSVAYNFSTLSSITNPVLAAVSPIYNGAPQPDMKYWDSYGYTPLTTTDNPPIYLPILSAISTPGSQAASGKSYLGAIILTTTINYYPATGPNPWKVQQITDARGIYQWYDYTQQTGNIDNAGTTTVYTCNSTIQVQGKQGLDLAKAQEITDTTPQKNAVISTTIYDQLNRERQDIDALGHSAYFTYNPTFKWKPFTITDVDGIVTTITYDGMGNVNSITQP